MLILPDDIPVDVALKRKIDEYLARGGGLIASFESGMNAEKTEFALEALGVTLTDEGPRDRSGELARGREYERGDYCEYIIPTGRHRQGIAGDRACDLHPGHGGRGGRGRYC